MVTERREQRRIESRGSNGSQRKQNHETRRDINAGSTRSAGCTFVHESSSQCLYGLRIVLSVIQSSSTRFTITSRKAGRRFMSHPYHELAHLWEFVTRSFDIRSCPGISAIVYYAIHEDVVTPTRRTGECFAINRCDTADPSISICYEFTGTFRNGDAYAYCSVQKVCSENDGCSCIIFSCFFFFFFLN